jgi:hypothetical protein
MDLLMEGEGENEKNRTMSTTSLLVFVVLRRLWYGTGEID